MYSGEKAALPSYSSTQASYPTQTPYPPLAQYPPQAPYPTQTPYPGQAPYHTQAPYAAQSPYPTQAPLPAIYDSRSAAAIAGQTYRDGLMAQCAQGIHQRRTQYGALGIIIAILFFPCGLIALCLDVETKCDRCGIRL